MLILLKWLARFERYSNKKEASAMHLASFTYLINYYNLPLYIN